MEGKARHGPCSQEAPELAGEKMRNQAIRNQCEREVSTGCYGNTRRGHSCCSSPKSGGRQKRRHGAGRSACQAQVCMAQHLVQDTIGHDKIGHDKICYFSAPPSLHLRNEKGERDTKAT